MSFRRLGMALVATTSALVLSAFAAGYTTYLTTDYPTYQETQP